MSGQDQIEYNEDEAVRFIQNYLPQDIKDKFTEDDINYIIDIIYDFYDEKGFMDDSGSDETVELDEDELIEYVIKNVKKDKVVSATPEEVSFVVQGELKYCESLGIFE